MIQYWIVVFVTTVTWPSADKGAYDHFQIFSQEKPAIECMIGHQGARLFKGTEQTLISVPQSKCDFVERRTVWRVGRHLPLPAK